ncbi:MAG: hypothetical protein H2069_10315 [Legionella sp.]|nr:hypothetical protein [Legionella sp.]
MSHSQDMSNILHQGKETLREEGQKALSEGKQTVKEGGQDWWAYVESHPLQTLVFGVIGYFALKGVCK